jgi:hypothetical protein
MWHDALEDEGSRTKRGATSFPWTNRIHGPSYFIKVEHLVSFPDNREHLVLFVFSFKELFFLAILLTLNVSFSPFLEN